MKKTNKSSYQKTPKPIFIALAVSFITNLLLFGILAINQKITDDAVSVLSDEYIIVNNGFSTYCSDNFRDLLEQKYKSQDNMTEDGIKVALAYVDYICNQDGDAASPYFLEGFKNYLNSQNIPFDDEDFS